MKKIIILNIALLVGFSVIGQEKIPGASGNVPKELTINGKPYSQYKAEQDALKQQKASKESLAANQPLPQGLTVKVSNDTKDPALLRMNEPVLRGGPDPDKAPNNNMAQTKEPVKEDNKEVNGVVGTPLMKPVMTGGIQQGTATLIVNNQKEENKARENLNKTQGIEPKQQTTVPVPAELKVVNGQKKD